MAAVTISTEPLKRAVDNAGGPAAVGVGKVGGEALRRSYFRAVQRGSLTLSAADNLAVRLLGRHPVEVWGQEWFEAVACATQAA